MWVPDYVRKSSGLPEWMISKCQKPVKAETLALTGFRHFEQVNQAVQREFSDNLFTQILWHSQGFPILILTEKGASITKHNLSYIAFFVLFTFFTFFASFALSS